MKNKKIALIGDLCLDRNVYVKSTRMCPEAPVPIVVPIRANSVDGMAGNVLANLMSMADVGIRDFLIYFPAVRSVKERFIDEATGHLMLRVDTECPKVEPFKPFEGLQEEIKKNNVSAIIVSDYAKGFLNENNIREIIRLSILYKVPVFLDTKLILAGWSDNVFCVKINEKEYDNHIIAGHYHPELHCKNLIVTRASQGTLLIRDEKTTIIKPVKVNVADVCGAGDVMLAALVLKYLRCHDILEATEFANAVASFSVTKRGTYAVTKDDIEALGLKL